MTDELKHPDLIVQVAHDICRHAGKSMAEMVWHQQSEIARLTTRVAELETGLGLREGGWQYFNRDLVEAAFVSEMPPLWLGGENE